MGCGPAELNSTGSECGAAKTRWSELDEHLERLQSTSVIARVVAAGVLGSLCVARGDEFEVPWPPDATPLSDDPADTAWIGFTVALAEWSTGRVEVALEHAVHAVDEMYALSGSSDDFVHMWPAAVELALQTGATATLDRLLGIVDADADRLIVPLSVRAHRARFAGLVAHREDPAAAEGQLRTAVELFSAWGSPHYRARAEADLAAVLETLSRGQEAAAMLARARATLVDVGAHAWLAGLQPVVA